MAVAYDDALLKIDCFYTSAVSKTNLLAGTSSYATRNHSLAGLSGKPFRGFLSSSCATAVFSPRIAIESTPFCGAWLSPQSAIVMRSGCHEAARNVISTLHMWLPLEGNDDAVWLVGCLLIFSQHILRGGLFLTMFFLLDKIIWLFGFQQMRAWNMLWIFKGTRSRTNTGELWWTLHTGA